MSKHVVEVPNPAQKIPGTDLMLHQVPSATDNLIWLISAPDGQTFAVDGPAIREVDSYCEEHRLNLMGILNTHTHGDHIGINHALMRAGRLDAMTVVGARKTADAIPGLTMPVEDGDPNRGPWYSGGRHAPKAISTAISLISSVARSFAEIPSLVVDADIFSMDHRELDARKPPTLGSLEPDTLVCCAHEYTEDNMRFAWWVGADSEALTARIREVSEVRGRGASTLPSTIGLECATNPFIRVFEETLIEACSKKTNSSTEPGAATFAKLRRLKDEKVYRDHPREGYPG